MGEDGDTLSKPTVYMKLYVNDLTRDTALLTAEEFGVYMRLLVAMWGNDAELELDHKRLARLCGVSTRAFTRIWESSIAKYFQVSGNCFTQKRLMNEYQIAISRTESAQLNGRSGGLKSAELKETGGSKRSSEIQASGQASHKSVVSSHKSYTESDLSEQRNQSKQTSTPRLVTLPCKDGSEWPVNRQLVTELRAAYPRVAIVGEARKARAWLVSNPEKQREPSEMAGWLNSWMSRAKPEPLATSASGLPSWFKSHVEELQEEAERKRLLAAQSDQSNQWQMAKVEEGNQ